MNKRFLLFIMLLILSGTVTLTAQQQYRSITALNFHYYTDDRSSLSYEEVFIIPLKNQYYLVTAVIGDASDFDATLGGKIGLAFDLPGFYYGETSFTYERLFDNSNRENVASLNGSVTYETGGTRASMDLTAEFADDHWGMVFSPGLNYMVRTDWELYLKYFSGYHRYGSQKFFNHAVWAGSQYEILPTIWLNLGGTFGTVYEPENSYEKWSIITGVKVFPVEDLSVRYQFEYETNPNYQIISNGVVVDCKF